MKTTTLLPSGSSLACLEQYSFSDEAGTKALQGSTGVSLAYHEKIAGVWDAVLNGDQYGLIPFENSSDGVVWTHLDRLLIAGVRIIGDIHHQVRMCVGGLAGADLRQATHVHSHQKALGQCSSWLQQMPNIELDALASTVAGVRFAAAQNDSRHITLGSRAAIEELGLTVLAEDIANLSGEGNITQFYVVKKNGYEAFPNPEALYHAAYLIPANRCGILHDITGVIKNARVDLTAVHSRQIGHKQYGFLFEMAREGDENAFVEMAQQLEQMTQKTKWLGSWDDRFET